MHPRHHSAAVKLSAFEQPYAHALVPNHAVLAPQHLGAQHRYERASVHYTPPTNEYLPGAHHRGYVHADVCDAVPTQQPPGGGLAHCGTGAVSSLATIGGHSALAAAAAQAVDASIVGPGGQQQQVHHHMHHIKHDWCNKDIDMHTYGQKRLFGPVDDLMAHLAQ